MISNEFIRDAHRWVNKNFKRHMDDDGEPLSLPSLNKELGEPHGVHIESAVMRSTGTVVLHLKDEPVALTIITEEL